MGMIRPELHSRPKARARSSSPCSKLSIQSLWRRLACTRLKTGLHCSRTGEEGQASIPPQRGIFVNLEIQSLKIDWIFHENTLDG
jgi:hypothetical protein